MTSRARDIVVVPCSGEKQKVPCTAEQMYLGQLHKLALEAARTLAVDDEHIRILSGKHGLLRLVDEIWPYDQRIDEPGAVATSVLVQQLQKIAPTAVVSLCPKAYTAALGRATHELGIELRNPLAGCRGIGQMRQQLCVIRGWERP